MTHFDPKTTALVMIDLQAGIVGRPLAPRSGDEVVETAKGLAAHLRTAGSLIIWVRVAFAPGGADAPPGQVDAPMALPPGGLPPDWSTLVAGLVEDGDIVVTKRQWGAFYGTGLDLELRRRGIRTIVLGGIATNFGVESTARSAWEHGYDLVIVEDACASASAELHEMAVRHVFPRLARVVKSADIPPQ